MTTGFPQLTHNKRRFVRFPAMCRVEYSVEGRTTFVFTQDLSLGGMQLRNVKLLARGDSVKFHLHLTEGGAPLQVDGLVQRVAPQSAGITFVPEQESAIAAISDFINQRLISRAAERALGSGGSAAQIADLAMYYGEIGRIDDALDLYRKSMSKRPQELVLYEHMATLMLYQAEQGGDRAWALLNELETLIGRGLGIGKSRVLDSVSRDVSEVRASLSKRQEAARRHERDQLFKEAEAHGQAAIAKAVAEKSRALDKEFHERLAGKDVRAQLAKHKQEHDKHKASLERELAALRKTIAAEQKKLERQAAKIAKDQSALDAAKHKHDKAAAALELAQKHSKAHDEIAKARETALDQRDHALSRRETQVATLEQLTQLIDKLHLANLALRTDVPPKPALAPRKTN